MKNIDQYKDTASALEAWKQYRATDNQNIGFGDWCELDWLEPLTLLEAAKAAENWAAGYAFASIAKTSVLRKLRAAITAEETRPKRNFERFKTAEDASREFTRMCCNTKCQSCRDDGITNCIARWLYSTEFELSTESELQKEKL